MPFRHYEVLSLARAQMVSNLLFFNLQLNIHNIGDTNRRSCTFIDVFRRNQNIRTVGNDAKLLGRWFVTTVRHRFEKDRYQNVLQCVKPCIGPVSEVNKDIEGLQKKIDKDPNFNINNMYA